MFTSCIRTRTIKTKGYSKSSLPLIRKEDYEILYGLLLGDLFISRTKSENAYLRFEQSIIHEGYLVHLFERFNYLCTKNSSIKVANRKLFNTSSVYFTTRQLIAITELHTLFYREGRKIVPHNIGSLLTAKSLAYWGMDDGEKHASGFIFNTSGFTLDDVKRLQAALLENWALETSIHSRNRLYVNSKSKSKLIELVRPHFYSKMLYKID
jgi:CRISPR/Cas system-associated protein endoribonuclease Cas2